MSEWRKEALCLGMDPNLFFPERGEDTNAAKMICGECPVRGDCLDVGLREQFGIWGGKSERTRRKMRTGDGHAIRRPADSARVSLRRFGEDAGRGEYRRELRARKVQTDPYASEWKEAHQ